MPNKNYIAGRAFEYRVKRCFEDLGYYVVRSYASKGIFDLIAVPPNFCKTKYSDVTLLIQCKKRDYVHPKELEVLKEASKRYFAICLIVTRDEKGHLVFKEISP